MFLSIWAKEKVEPQPLFARGERLLRQHAEAAGYPSVTCQKDGLVCLYYAGSTEVNRLLRQETGSWIYSLGFPFDPESTGTTLELQRWLAVGLEQQDEDHLLRGLGGHFVLLIYNAANRTLRIWPDMNYIGLVFYLETAEYVALSNVAGLLAGLGGCPIDPIGAAGLHYNGYLPGRRTLFEGVRFLGNLTSAAVSAKGLAIRSVAVPFSVQVAPPRQLSELADQIGEIYRQDIQGLSRRFSERYTFLLGVTGGFDSRVVAAIAKKAGLALHCFHHATTSSESDISRQVACSLDLDLTLIQTPSLPPTQFMDALLQRSRLYDGEIPGPFGIYDFAVRFAGPERMLLFGIGSEGIIKTHWKIGGRATWQASNARIAEILAQQYTRSPYYHLPLFRGAPVRDEGLAYTSDAFQADVRDLPKLPPLTVANYLYCRHRLPRFLGRFINACQEIVPCYNPLASFRIAALTAHAPTALFEFQNLVRTLAVTASPALAPIPYADGTPGQPDRDWQRWGKRANGYLQRALHLAARLSGIDVQSRKREQYLRWLATQDLAPQVTWRQLYDTTPGRQLLNPDNLRTAGLYNMDEYRRVLAGALDQPFSAHHPLAAALQIEIAAQRLEGALP